ncbi:hypothetical protein FN846DRAFT_890925 [Sphaerosporella brunnea]|uniref:Uncharacterized protein n=1 Tax=Sphaerosporella brunnea TaxID=1250544 RepID=A0A5J5EUX2_9PEZI|nr:hypothetical protein FN846DRAFT_890925 [Sphaerosporella brunnea]
MRSDPALQAALNAYSVAVQRYKTLSDLLPRHMRPPVLERFQHRENRWPIERRTADVRKVISRMERQLAGVQPQVAPPAASPAQPTAPHDELAGETAAATAAEQIARHDGQLRQPTVGTESKQHEEHALSDDFKASTKSSVVTPRKTGGSSDKESPFANNSLCDSAVCGPDEGSTDDMPHDGSDVLSRHDGVEDVMSPAEEIDAVVRVGVVSPDAAIQMTRVVERLKADGTSPAIVKKVYTTFLRCAEAGPTFPEVDFGAMKEDEA